jgi:hypothetical protein
MVSASSRRVGPDGEVRRAGRLAGGQPRTRASSAMAPSWLTISGLMSSSASLGHVGQQLRHGHQRGDHRVHVGRRHVAPAVQQRATRVRSISARASGTFSGGSATARSATTSTAVPPWPNRMTGPNTGSTLAPTISSCACFAPHHRLHGEAFDARLGGRPDAGQHGLRGGAHVASPFQVQRHAADVGLVRDLPRGSSAPPESRCAPPRPLRVGIGRHRARGHHGDAVGLAAPPWPRAR